MQINARTSDDAARLAEMWYPRMGIRLMPAVVPTALTPCAHPHEFNDA